MEKKKIVVTGDVTVDLFMYPVEGKDEGYNWQLHPSLHDQALPGGALLLAEFVKAGLKSINLDADLCVPDYDIEWAFQIPQKIIRSNALLEKFEKDKDGRQHYRVAQSQGYIGPREDSSGNEGGALEFLSPKPDPKHADIIVLDDAGNGFRNNSHSWPQAIDAGDDPIIVYKMSRPLAEGDLWNALMTKHKDNDRLVVILNAWDIRKTQGVNIGASLSWERTARDFLFQMLKSEKLGVLQQCPYVITLFDVDGAILFRGKESFRTDLFFDSQGLEGAFKSGITGQMHGGTSVFTAALATRLAQGGIPRIEEGIQDGLVAVREFLKLGMEKSSRGEVRYPVEKIFSQDLKKQGFGCCTIPPENDVRKADPGFWRIMDEKTRNTRRIVAEEIVKSGSAGDLMRHVPTGIFGNLETIDRAEIESYSAIRELILEFLANPKPPRPLCFAVFGPPGSGKSFGVKQVVKSLKKGDMLASKTLNISQFRSYDDLVAGLHEVRDIALGNKVPFVFFDEFDSAFEGKELGWLKYFLAPMQDGEFKHGESVHPLGKSILVFAGGTRSSFENFVNNVSDDRDMLINDDTRESTEQFRDAKGPDFVSRLRGFINVMGPDRQVRYRVDARENRIIDDYDEAYIIRRAKILRVLLSMNRTAEGLFDNQKRLRIDDGVLRALLSISRFKHGVRSMESIIDMSRLAGKDRFDLSCLPPVPQLDLHVDAEEFMFYTEKERFQSMLLLKDLKDIDESSYNGREDHIALKIARQIHQRYVYHRQLRNPSVKIPDFDNLSEDDRQSNISAAEDIPGKMRAIGCGIRKIPENHAAMTPDISDDEIELLARMEHERFCREKRLQQFRFGEKDDKLKKISSKLKPYDELSGEDKAFNRTMILDLPIILKQLGYEIYRMQESEEFEDEYLIDSLSRFLHEQYRKERQQNGETLQKNPSLRPFDELSDDLKGANIDHARSIPRKLRAIGYEIKKAQKGALPTLLELSDDELEEIAIMEHTRWNWDKIMRGWVYRAGEKDEDKKTTPYLVPWKDLAEKIREYDRELSRLIPEMLRRAGYEACRINPDASAQ